MKWFIILLLLSSCTFDEHKHCKVHKVKNTIEYKTITCPKFNGLGKVEPSTSYKVGYVIMSFGAGLINCSDPVECEYCNGKGYVKIPKPCV